jgi:hypothetical protein
MLKDDRVLFLAFMIAFALASFTDNTLSSPPTLITFFTLAVVVQSARQRAAMAGQVAAPQFPPGSRASVHPAPGE